MNNNFFDGYLKRFHKYSAIMQWIYVFLNRISSTAKKMFMAPFNVVSDLVYGYLRKERDECINSLKDYLHEISTDAYEGKYGKGTLVLINKRDLKRFVGVGTNKQIEYCNKILEEKSLSLNEYALGANGKYELWANPAHNFTPSGDIRHHSWERVDGGFFEVSIEKFPPSKEELENLFSDLLDNRSLTWNELINLFGKELFFQKVEVGQEEFVSSCSHHSGEIEAYQMLLPSKKFALIIKYSGEFNPGSAWFHGFSRTPWVSENVSLNAKRVDVWIPEDFFFEDVDSLAEGDRKFLSSKTYI